MEGEEKEGEREKGREGEREGEGGKGREEGIAIITDY